MEEQSKNKISEEEKQLHGRPNRPKGGLITMPFIFANEICEKLAVVGFHANMISYLTTQLHLPLTKAANTLTNFAGTSSLTPLLGAFIADSFAGRFWTITFASIIYQIGMTLLTISAIIPTLRPPPCKGEEVCVVADTAQLSILYVALLLGALGSGGIRPCVVAFGADQFDESDPNQTTKTWNYFNWYYFCMGAAVLLAVTVLVWIQDNVGWGLGLGIPTVAMFLSVIAFVGGFQLYRHLDPAGSPFTRLIQVGVAAFRKRKLRMVSDPSLLYFNDEIDAPISLGGKLTHTKHMSFLDKAAIVTEQDNLKPGQIPNHWRLSTVHRVEELKSVIRMGPIGASGILLITAYAQQGTFSLQQAKTMNRHLTNSFQIPAGSMSVFTTIAMLTTIVFYDRIFVKVARKFTGLERGITFLHRMGIGFVISIIATLVAGFVEIKRKSVAIEHGLLDKPHTIVPISFLWLIPQYGLHGVAEAFMSIGHLEFFYDQAPESMRSTATALFWMAISIGNYVSTLLVTLVHKFSAKPDGSNWLPDNNLNRGRLEYFYWLITVLQAVNLVYYLWCAKIYTYKPVQVHHSKEHSSPVKDELQLSNRSLVDA
ncbi:Proton-dependent oligopeptide transporter family [Arabidopsis thaliana x Arabidopsis arenosa]|uniref:Proton-dependent oligopeptide transporter family n=1 Tax=Arabidopsis thaliana x Arabidopsis arenosa TaxID=1240361 RepID=A0A8T2BRR7_9BRAS|nr:Proton-dependent oligopeptide transporter family [Arabidopsis thaliana x Arabidopsis arenosa]